VAEKLYVVVSVGFNYNDEIHSSYDGDAGTPIKAFRNKKSAEDYASELERKKFSGLELREYCYDLNDLVDDWDKLEEVINEIYRRQAKVSDTCAHCDAKSFVGLPDSRYCPECGEARFKVANLESAAADEVVFPQELTKEDVDKLHEAISLRFYHVVEVDGDE
jgi:rubredoxin